MIKRAYFAVAAGILAVLVIAGAVALSVLPNRGGAGIVVSKMFGTTSSGASVAPMMAGLMADSGANYRYAEDSYSMPSPMPPVYDQRGGQTAAEVDQKIIKNGSLRLSVDDVAATGVRVTEIAKARGGFVQTSNVAERADGTHTGYVTVRVPALAFEETMTEIRGLAKAVKEENASGQDVTEEFTDLQAQIKNARAQEATYLEVLKSAKTVEDILKVQERLGSIRGQIESLQGREKYLENVTSYSTVSVTLEEEPKIQVPTKEFRPLNQVKQAVSTLVEGFQSMISALIWIIIVLGGLLLPFALLAVIVWAVWRRRKSYQS